MKVYARTTAGDGYVDWVSYLEPYVEDGNIIIIGNERACSVNSEQLQCVDSMVGDIDMGYDERQAVIEHVHRDDHQALTDDQIDAVLEVLHEDSRNPDYTRELCVTVLGVIKGKMYDCYPICGCCQGDRADVYAPLDTLDSVIEEIEAIYFNTGTEVIIDDEDEQIDDPNDIHGYAIYTSKYDEDDIKAEIADQAGCDVEDVVLWMFDGYTKTAKYRKVEEDE